MIEIFKQKFKDKYRVNVRPHDIEILYQDNDNVDLCNCIILKCYLSPADRYKTYFHLTKDEDSNVIIESYQKTSERTIPSQEFTYYKDTLQTVVRREKFTISACSKEEADKLAKQELFKLGSQFETVGFLEETAFDYDPDEDYNKFYEILDEEENVITNNKTYNE